MVVKAIATPLSCSALRISAGRTARGAAACRISSIMRALVPRRGRLATEVSFAAAFGRRKPVSNDQETPHAFATRCSIKYVGPSGPIPFSMALTLGCDIPKRAANSRWVNREAVRSFLMNRAAS